MPPDDTDLEVPLIDIPPDDDLDDAANREALEIESGNLTLHVRGCTRKMDAYTVTSTELDGLTIWGIMENKAYTIASGSASFALGLFFQAAFSDFGNLTPLAQAICFVGIPFGVLLALASFFVGKYLSGQKVGLQNTIKEETTTNDDP